MDRQLITTMFNAPYYTTGATSQSKLTILWQTAHNRKFILTLYRETTVRWTETEVEDRQAFPSLIESHRCVTSIPTVHHLCQISS